MKQYNIDEISKMLKVNPETVRRWARSDSLKATKTCKKDGYLVDEADLIQFARNKLKYLVRLEQEGLLKCEADHAPYKIVLKLALRDLKRDLESINKRIDEIEKLLEES